MQGEKETPALRPDGLPSYITDEMVQTAQDMQKQYGHPAGCTLAQIIQESGQGTGLSALAEQDNNLFGMKWAASFEGKPGVVGPVDWGTNEEYDGATVSITGTFIRFESQKACIEFRSSVFLQASTYADNPTIKCADRDGQFCADGVGLAGCRMGHRQFVRGASRLADGSVRLVSVRRIALFVRAVLILASRAAQAELSVRSAARHRALERKARGGLFGLAGRLLREPFH